MSRSLKKHPLQQSLCNCLDQRVTVWISCGQLVGVVGMTEDESVLVLHTQEGMMDIMISAIIAVRYEKDQQLIG